MDIGFIIDGSGSIRDANPSDGSFDNWNLLLQFVASVIDRLPRSGTQVGAVLFSDRGELLFRLNRYTNLENARDAILRTRYPGANTNTSGGLYVARTQLFNVNNGDRPNVPNLAIVITDGKSTFDSDRTLPIAADLRAAGVQMVSIGITNSVDENELRGLSSLPQRENVNYFTSPDFQQLGQIIDTLLASACVVTPPPATTRRPSKSFNVYSYVRVAVPSFCLFMCSSCCLLILSEAGFTNSFPCHISLQAADNASGCRML